MYLTQKGHWLIKVTRAFRQLNEEPMQEAQARGQRLWPSFQGIAGAANKHAEMDLGPKWNNNPLTNTYSLM